MCCSIRCVRDMDMGLILKQIDTWILKTWGYVDWLNTPFQLSNSFCVFCHLMKNGLVSSHRYKLGKDWHFGRRSWGRSRLFYPYATAFQWVLGSKKNVKNPFQPVCSLPSRNVFLGVSCNVIRLLVLYLHIPQDSCHQSVISSSWHRCRPCWLL